MITMAVLHFQRIERVGDRERGLSPLVVRVLVTGVAVFLAITIVENRRRNANVRISPATK